MRFKSIGLMAVAATLAVAPQAFALGSSSNHSGPTSGLYSGTASNGTISGTFNGGTYNGTYNNGTFTGTYTLNAAEPLSAFAVGLGLLGARYLRRRK